MIGIRRFPEARRAVRDRTILMPKLFTTPVCPEGNRGTLEVGQSCHYCVIASHQIAQQVAHQIGHAGRQHAYDEHLQA